MAPDDVLIQKAATIERCIKQIETYQTLVREQSIEQGFLVQDAIATNVQRACEAAIDMANRVVRVRGLRSEVGTNLIAARGRVREIRVLQVGFRAPGCCPV